MLNILNIFIEYGREVYWEECGKRDNEIWWGDRMNLGYVCEWDWLDEVF